MTKLHWAGIFTVLAVIAAGFGFGKAEADLRVEAQILFCIFVPLALGLVLAGTYRTFERGGPAPRPGGTEREQGPQRDEQGAPFQRRP